MSDDMKEDNPERIWADVQVFQGGYYGMKEWAAGRIEGVQEWVRADLYEQLEAENARLQKQTDG